MKKPGGTLLPRIPRIVVTWKGWQIIVQIAARLRRREKPVVVPAEDTDPDGGWVCETRD